MDPRNKVKRRWYAATSALKELTLEQRQTDTLVIIGCGPVILTRKRR
jgi:hypothetical protein